MLFCSVGPFLKSLSRNQKINDNCIPKLSFAFNYEGCNIGNTYVGSRGLARAWISDWIIDGRWWWNVEPERIATLQSELTWILNFDLNNASTVGGKYVALACFHLAML